MSLAPSSAPRPAGCCTDHDHDDPDYPDDHDDHDDDDDDPDDDDDDDDPDDHDDNDGNQVVGHPRLPHPRPGRTHHALLQDGLLHRWADRPHDCLLTMVLILFLSPGGPPKPGYTGRKSSTLPSPGVNGSFSPGGDRSLH